MLTGRAVGDFDERQFETDILEQIRLMKGLSEKNGVEWYISEVWIYGRRPEIEEKERLQAKAFKVLFDTLEKTNASLKGVLIMNWNMKEADIFADIKGREAEHIVKNYFSSH